MMLSSSKSGTCSPRIAKSPEVVNQRKPSKWQPKLVLDRPPAVTYSNTEVLDEPREEWEEPAFVVTLLQEDIKGNEWNGKIIETRPSQNRTRKFYATSNTIPSSGIYKCSNSSNNSTWRRRRIKKPKPNPGRGSKNSRERKSSHNGRGKDRRDRNNRNKLSRQDTKSRSWSRTIVSRSSSVRRNRHNWEQRSARSPQARRRESSCSKRRRQSYPGSFRNLPQIKFEKERSRLAPPVHTYYDAELPQARVKTPNYEPTTDIKFEVKQEVNMEDINFNFCTEDKVTLTPLGNERPPRTPINFEDFKVAAENDPRTPINFEDFKVAAENDSDVATRRNASTQRIEINSPGSLQSDNNPLSSIETIGRRGRKRLSDASSTSPPKKLHKSEESKRERETDPNRILQRLKQVDKGKNCRAYRAYRAAVAKSSRRGYDEHPRTPNVLEKVSNRRWKGKCNKWRRLVHKWERDNLVLDEGTKKRSDDHTDIALDSDDGLQKSEDEEDISSLSLIKYSDESSRESEGKNSGGQTPLAPDFDL